MNPESPCRFRFGARVRRAVALVLLFGQVAQVLAADCETGREVPGRALDEISYRQLNAVYEAVAEEAYDEAFEDLRRMLRRAGSDDYLNAILNQAMAQIEWTRENYDSALSYFETAVGLDALPNAAHFALMYQIAQLYYVQERYPKALEKLEQWFCIASNEQITSAAYVLEASAQTAMEHYPQALEAIDKAIERAQDMREAPPEQWYQLKLAVQLWMEKYSQAVDTLEIMIARWPEKSEYWIQIAQGQLALGQDEQALATMALAYRKGLLRTESDISLLSTLYSNAGVPYKSAEVLQSGIEAGALESTGSNWARAAAEWYAAEELDKALAAYELAGGESERGEIDLRRGFILADLERWTEARDALDAAIGKGGLQDRQLGDAYLMRGMVQFNLGNFDQAGTDWGRASRFESTRTAAEQWIAHLREERRRQAR